MSVANPTPRLKRVCMTIGGDTSNNLTGFTDILQRYLVALPVTPTRWRLRIRNTGNAGTVTLTDLYLGTPVFAANGSWAGTIAASPTDVLTGLSLPTDGSEYVTNWVADNGTYFTPDVPKVLSLGMTPSSGTVALANGHNTGMCWFLSASTGPAADVAVATPTHGTLTKAQNFLDVRLEYEAVTALPIVMFVGDSITSGNGPNTALSDAAVSGPMASFPAIAGMLGRFLWINAGIGGTLTSDWVSSSYKGYTRVAAWSEGDLGSAVAIPDVAVNCLGVNDANGAVVVGTWAPNYVTVNANLQAIGIKRICAATIFPQGRFKPGVLMAGAASGATTLQTSVPYANADSLEIEHEQTFASQTAQNETVTVSGASTGTQAPYTTTVSATAKNHRQGAVLGLSGTESKRLDYNAAIRQGLGNVYAVLDFAKATAEPATSNCPAVQYFSVVSPDTTSIHPNAEGHQVAGLLASILGG